MVVAGGHPPTGDGTDIRRDKMAKRHALLTPPSLGDTWQVRTFGIKMVNALTIYSGLEVCHATLTQHMHSSATYAFISNICIHQQHMHSS